MADLNHFPDHCVVLQRIGHEENVLAELFGCPIALLYEDGAGDWFQDPDFF